MIFLKWLITNDVMKVTSDRALYAALLTAQGRYLHDFFLVEHGDTFLLDGEAARLVDLTRRLNIYRLRSKVTLKPASGRWEVFVAFGNATLAGLDLPVEAGRAKPFLGGTGFVDPRLAVLGARLILPRGTGVAALRERGFAVADPGDYDRLRLSLGVPESGRDLMPEKSLLLESRLRRVERRRLEQGLLYRPGVDRAYEISRADQETADAGRRDRRHARRRKSGDVGG